MPTRVSFVVDDSEVRSMELLTRIQGLKKVSFRGMTDISIVLVERPTGDTDSSLQSSQREDVMQASITELGLSRRTVNCLQHALLNDINGIPQRREDCDITTIGELLRKTRKELLRYYDLGPKRVDEIEVHLAQLGFQLAQEENPT